VNCAVLFSDPKVTGLCDKSQQSIGKSSARYQMKPICFQYLSSISGSVCDNC